jgi:hypothetical protein
MDRMSEFEWPGLPAFERYPVCGQNAQPFSATEGIKRYLIFYQISQQIGGKNSKRNYLSLPLLIHRLICRLACTRCMDAILAGKVPSHIDDGYSEYFGGNPIFETVQLLPAMLIVQRSGDVASFQGGMGAYTMSVIWRDLGLFETVEKRDGSHLFSDMARVLGRPVVVPSSSGQPPQNPSRPRNMESSV